MVAELSSTAPTSIRAAKDTGLPRNWIAADVVRIADGVLAEHWDALQDEAARAESKGGLPMFGGRVHPDDEIRKRKRVVLIARRSLPIYPMNGHRKIGPACLKSAMTRRWRLSRAKFGSGLARF